MSQTDNVLSDYFSEADAAGELRVCAKTLQRWRALGEGPPVTRLGRTILYRKSSLRAWLASQEGK